MSLRFLGLSLALLALPATAQTTYTVTTTADAGSGSLREAITQANANDGPDIIAFAIEGGGGYQEIFLQSLLPVVTGPVVIDGDTQGCDTSGGPCIRLDGDLLTLVEGVDNAGLLIAGGESTVHGLLFTRFFAESGAAALRLPSANNTVTGCYFGTDRSGSVTDPDEVPASGDELGNGFGISVLFFEDLAGAAPTGNVIGGPLPSDRNIVAGSTFSGIFLGSRLTTGTLIEGNFVGTNAEGTAALGNVESGILLGDSTSQNTVRDNLISGNEKSGLTIQTGASDNLVTGNAVGTNAQATAAVPNGTLAGLALLEGIGITVSDASDNAVTENLVSGNLLAGIVIGFANITGEPGPFLTSGNVVSANQIGTDGEGVKPIPNGVAGVPDVGFGVVFFAGANVTVTGNTIGGASTGADPNVIVYDTSAGIGAEGPGVVGNVIDGNLIGITADESPAPNGQVGILLRNGPSGNRIGTAEPDFEDDLAGNLIAFQPLAVALGPFTGGNDVAFNLFLGPAGAYLPVDLGLDGPTAGDAGDGDEGPNRLQNAPTILSATAPSGSDQITVRYQVDTDPANTTYPLTVRFYGQALDGDLLVHFPLGAATYTGPGDATATFENVLDGSPLIVATATDAMGNTSEVSLVGFSVAGAQGPSALDPARVGPNPTAGPVRVQFGLAAPADVSVALYDMLGREVATVGERRLEAGSHHVVLEADLPAGIYLWRLQAGSRVESGRVTVVR